MVTRRCSKRTKRTNEEQGRKKDFFPNHFRCSFTKMKKSKIKSPSHCWHFQTKECDLFMYLKSNSLYFFSEIKVIQGSILRNVIKSVALVFEKALGFDFFNYGKQMIRRRSTKRQECLRLRIPYFGNGVKGKLVSKEFFVKLNMQILPDWDTKTTYVFSAATTVLLHTFPTPTKMHDAENYFQDFLL